MDPLELVGGRLSLATVCMGLEMFRKSLEMAEVGDNVGVLIRGIKRDEVKRGYVLAAPNTVRAYVSFDAKVYILTKKEGGRHKPFVSNYKPQFFFRTANVTGIITLPNEISVVMPGDSLVLHVELLDKVALTLGMRFIMREGNLTIGAGVVIKLN